MDINELIIKRNNIRRQINQYYNEIAILQQEMKHLEDKIYKLCLHEWVTDNLVISEHTRYICAKCGLKYNS